MKASRLAGERGVGAASAAGAAGSVGSADSAGAVGSVGSAGAVGSAGSAGSAGSVGSAGGSEAGRGRGLSWPAGTGAERANSAKSSGRSSRAGTASSAAQVFRRGQHCPCETERDAGAHDSRHWFKARSLASYSCPGNPRRNAAPAAGALAGAEFLGRRRVVCLRNPLRPWPACARGTGRPAVAPRVTRSHRRE